MFKASLVMRIVGSAALSAAFVAIVYYALK